ncbi:MAG: agmatinase family protein [Planctomycetota bacterium]
MTSFDPNRAARPGSGIFGLEDDPEVASVLLMPVPFDATTSYRPGAARGPGTIRDQSHQVELYDPETGRPYARGIHLLPEDPEIVAANAAARRAAVPVIARGGAGRGDAEAVAAVDHASEQVNERVRSVVAGALDRGQLPGVVGGDHSVAFGGIAAVAARHPGMGILHVDAHADLRRAYMGFEWSHASIMDNVLRKVEGVVRLVQVGIRDVSEQELERAREDDRIVLYHEAEWRWRLLAGESWLARCREAVAVLPEEVHVSFDIDGLDPSLCPGTGTPVPGGLSFAEASALLRCLVESGRRIVGFDLTEVNPGDADDEWNGAVGARILYKLVGFALLTR